jgi:DNA polymerase-3 subunit delta'
MARAHPDLLVLQSDAEDGKTRRGIPVEEARSISEFFSKSPAASPWRVAIVDTADDLRSDGANALLKTLEEPPARGVIFLLSHAPGGLLATLRSRCRRLAIRSAESESALTWLEARAGIEAGEAAQILPMACGAPGAAWRLASEGALEVDAAACELIASLKSLDPARLQVLADSFRGAAGATRFALFFDRLAGRVHARALAGARAGERDAPERWAGAWSQLIELPRRAEAVNLDRGEVFFSVVARLSAL